MTDEQMKPVKPYFELVEEVEELVSKYGDYVGFKKAGEVTMSETLKKQGKMGKYVIMAPKQELDELEQKLEAILKKYRHPKLKKQYQIHVQRYENAEDCTISIREAKSTKYYSVEEVREAVADYYEEILEEPLKKIEEMSEEDKASALEGVQMIIDERKEIEGKLEGYDADQAVSVGASHGNSYRLNFYNTQAGKREAHNINCFILLDKEQDEKTEAFPMSLPRKRRTDKKQELFQLGYLTCYEPASFTMRQYKMKQHKKSLTK